MRCLRSLAKRCAGESPSPPTVALPSKLLHNACMCVPGQCQVSARSVPGQQKAQTAEAAERQPQTITQPQPRGSLPPLSATPFAVPDADARLPAGSRAPARLAILSVMLRPLFAADSASSSSRSALATLAMLGRSAGSACQHACTSCH